MLDQLAQIISHTAGRIKKILSIVMIYLFLVSIIVFSLFILEESGQVFIWSTWPAQDANRWDLVKNGLDGIEYCRKTMNTINYSLGWLNPFAFVSYRAFAKSMTAYEASLRANILRKDPAAYLGENIKFEFTATSMMKDGSGIRLIGGGLVVWVNEEVRPGRFMVEGTVEMRGTRAVIVGNRMEGR